jgi:antitoxin CcdA
MRMKKRQLADPTQPFQGAEPSKHNGHIGPGPKSGPKRAVNVSIDAEILGVAKDMGVNLSQTLEDALRKSTDDERIRRWQEENREAIESQIAFFERNGTLTEAWLAEQGEQLDTDDPTV